MNIITKYFPNITDKQKDQFAQLYDLYDDWNSKINVISRKDIVNLYERHVLHSLAIAKYIKFVPGSRIVDLGTGGGFPGIPLAILFPEVDFTLIDGIRKKITVVNEVNTVLGLHNVRALQKRAEEHKEKYDFVVTRAVAKMGNLIQWSQKLIKASHKNALPNGIIALKGGNIGLELEELGDGIFIDMVPLADYYDEPFFEEKYVVYYQY